MRWAWPTSALAVALCAAAFACRSGAFACSDDQQCGAGVCESTGYCSFPDASCDSGQRYGELAASELAGQCVDPSPGGDSGSSGSTVPSTTGEPPPDTSNGDTTVGDPGAGSTAALADSTTSAAGESTADVTIGGSGSTGTTGPGQVCPDLFDDFEDGVIDPVWELSHPEFIVEAGGVLQIIVDPPIGPFVEAIVPDAYDVSQGWFRAELAETSDSVYAQQDVELFNGDDVDESFVVIVEGDNLIARYRPVGGGFENIVVTEFVPGEHVWVQLRGEGDTIYFETSPDGVTFESFASYVSPFSLSNVRPGLRASNYMTLAADDIVSYEQIALCSQP